MTWAKVIARARRELRLLAWHQLRSGYWLDAYETWCHSRILGRKLPRMLPTIVLPRFTEWAFGPQPSEECPQCHRPMNEARICRESGCPREARYWSQPSEGEEGGTG